MCKVTIKWIFLTTGLASLFGGGTLALSSPYQEALDYFDSGSQMPIQFFRELVADGPLVDRRAKCANTMQPDEELEKAAAILPMEGRFAPTVYFGFEWYDHSDSDQEILDAAATTQARYWSVMSYNSRLGAYQRSVVSILGEQFMEFRLVETSAHSRFVMRIHYADHDVREYYRGRYYFIPAFHVAEICWLPI